MMYHTLIYTPCEDTQMPTRFRIISSNDPEAFEASVKQGEQWMEATAEHIAMVHTHMITYEGETIHANEVCPFVFPMT